MQAFAACGSFQCLESVGKGRKPLCFCRELTKYLKSMPHANDDSFNFFSLTCRLVTVLRHTWKETMSYLSATIASL